MIRHSAFSSNCSATWHLRSVHILCRVPRSSWRQREHFHPICCVSQSCCGWMGRVMVNNQSSFVASLNVAPAMLEMIRPAVKKINWLEREKKQKPNVEQQNVCVTVWTIMKKDLFRVSSCCSHVLLPDRCLAGSNSSPLEKQALYTNRGLFDHISHVLKANGAFLSFLVTGGDSIVFVERQTATIVTVQRMNVCQSQCL